MDQSSDIDRSPTLAEKVAFLSAPGVYPGAADPVRRHETHMSWLFFTDGAVYKLKKPVRFDYLDFSTLHRRERACRAEYALNQTLAPQIYKAVVPLVRTPTGLAIGGPGEVVDWLVVMRRLDESQTLESRLLGAGVTHPELDMLAVTLARFYRRARRVHRSAPEHLRDWRRAIDINSRVLLNPALGLPAGKVRAVLAVQRRFVRFRASLLAQRARDGHIVDAHGDLRPEHVWMSRPIKVIDRLEFSAKLRAVDPLDEIAFLDLETERYGAPAVGARIRRRVAPALCDRSAPELYLFYRSSRAMMRARLAIAHLLDKHPRTPEKWPRQARVYLRIAAADARRLDVLLRRPPGR
ncbi:MAG TPA: hypothetical protein VFW47_17800 [Phenylobacterium sp.]|nr:hypothetical protein [Phenylobacterium sp.]